MSRLEGKRKEAELLKELQRRNAAQAKFKVYAESVNNEDKEKSVQSQVRQDSSLQQPSFPNVNSKPFIPTQVRALQQTAPLQFLVQMKQPQLIL